MPGTSSSLNLRMETLEVAPGQQRDSLVIHLLSVVLSMVDSPLLHLRVRMLQGNITIGPSCGRDSCITFVTKPHGKYLIARSTKLHSNCNRTVICISLWVYQVGGEKQKVHVSGKNKTSLTKKETAL